MAQANLQTGSLHGPKLVLRRQRLCTPFKACSVRTRTTATRKIVGNATTSSEHSANDQYHDQSRRGLLLAGDDGGGIICGPRLTDLTQARRNVLMAC